MHIYKIMTLGIVFVFGSFLFNGADAQAASAGGGGGTFLFIPEPDLVLSAEASVINEFSQIEFNLKKRNRNSVRLRGVGSFIRTAKLVRGGESVLFYNIELRRGVSVSYIEDDEEGNAVFAIINNHFLGNDCHVSMPSSVNYSYTCLDGVVLITMDDVVVTVKTKKLNKRLAKFKIKNGFDGEKMKPVVARDEQVILPLSDTKHLVIEYSIVNSRPHTSMFFMSIDDSVTFGFTFDGSGPDEIPLEELTVTGTESLGTTVSGTVMLFTSGGGTSIDGFDTGTGSSTVHVTADIGLSTSTGTILIPLLVSSSTSVFGSVAQ
jgi:hypothetical protein